MVPVIWLGSFREFLIIIEMINTKNSEENLTETATKAANTVENVKSTEPARPQRNVSGTSQFWSVVTKARRTFEKQLDISNDVKRRCLEHFISTVTTDPVKFWADYMDEVNILLDSRKFERECEELGVDKTNIATHLVFLGSGMRNKVMRYGIRSVIGNDYILYKDRFIPDEAMQFALDYKPEKKEAEDTETAA